MCSHKLGIARSATVSWIQNTAICSHPHNQIGRVLQKSVNWLCSDLYLYFGDCELASRRVTHRFQNKLPLIFSTEQISVGIIEKIKILWNHLKIKKIIKLKNSYSWIQLSKVVLRDKFRHYAKQSAGRVDPVSDLHKVLSQFWSHKSIILIPSSYLHRIIITNHVLYCLFKELTLNYIIKLKWRFMHFFVFLRWKITTLCIFISVV